MRNIWSVPPQWARSSATSCTLVCMCTAVPLGPKSRLKSYSLLESKMFAEARQPKKREKTSAMGVICRSSPAGHFSSHILQSPDDQQWVPWKCCALSSQHDPTPCTLRYSLRKTESWVMSPIALNHPWSPQWNWLSPVPSPRHGWETGEGNCQF